MNVLHRRSVVTAIAASALLPRAGRAQAQSLLRIGTSGFPPARANAFANIQTPAIIFNSALFDGLTRLNKDGSLSPGLALSWEAVEPTRWRFKLREGVVFSNGRPFDANAIVHAIGYLTAPGPASEGLRREMSPFLVGAEAVDPSTVDIITKFPVPALPRYAAVLLIVEPGAWKELGPDGFADKPAGTGPMIAESWAPGRIVFKRNPTSWRPAGIDGVEFLLLPDVPSRLQAMLSGRLDVVYSLPPEDIQVVTDAGGTITSNRDGAASAIFFMFGGGRATPLSDVRVRRALNMAVDRQAIVDVLLAGRTALSNQPTVHEAFGFDPSIAPYPFDVDGAKKLLAEAGHGTGFPMTLEIATGNMVSLMVAQRVADDLARIGVKTEVRQKPVIQFLTDFVRGRFETDALMVQWGAYPTLDAVQFTTGNSCRKDKGWYCDPKIMPTIDAAWTETDPAKALELRHTIMRHYHDEAPGLFLYENTQFIGLSPRTTGFESAFGIVSWENVRLGKT